MAKCDTILGLNQNRNAFKKLGYRKTKQCLVVGVYRNSGKDNRRYTNACYCGSYAKWRNKGREMQTKCLYRVVVKLKNDGPLTSTQKSTKC